MFMRCSRCSPTLRSQPTWRPRPRRSPGLQDFAQSPCTRRRAAIGARPESTLATVSPTGFLPDPELVWTLREDDWRKRTRDSRRSLDDVGQRIRQAVEAAQSELRQGESPETVEPYPLFLFDRRRKE